MKKRNWRLVLRRVLNLVFSRIVVTGVLLLLQAFWLFALFYWLADYAKWFGGVGVAMSIIMCLALIRQDSTVPEFKISWMILFSVMPVQGGILYLLWGNKRPALGLRHRLERAEDAMAPARKDDPDAAAALQRQDPRAALTARYLHDYGPMPVCGGTAAKYYPDGQSMFADMLPALQGRSTAFMWRALSSAWARCGADPRDFAPEGRGRAGRAGHLRRRGLPEPAAPQLRRDDAGRRHPGVQLQPLRAGAEPGHEQPRPPQDHGHRRADRLYGRCESGGRVYQ